MNPIVCVALKNRWTPSPGKLGPAQVSTQANKPDCLPGKVAGQASKPGLSAPTEPSGTSTVTHRPTNYPPHSKPGPKSFCHTYKSSKNLPKEVPASAIASEVYENGMARKGRKRKRNR